MGLSTSSRVDRNCQTEPYSFSAKNPVHVMACTKSVHGNFPCVDVVSGLKNMVRNTLKARALTAMIGCGSSAFGGSQVFSWS